MKTVELWNVRQVAAALHRKPGGVAKAAQLAKLPFPAVTRRPWTFRREDVERYMRTATAR